MPTMASIVVKKNDNTTDITYDALSASGGDSSPAFWRQDTGAVAGLPVGLRNTLRCSTQWNGPKSARQMKFNFVAPYAVQDSTTTLYSAKDRVVLDGIMTLPQGIPSTFLDEAASQCLHLLASTLMKSIAKSGYAAT